MTDTAPHSYLRSVLRWTLAAALLGLIVAVTNSWMERSQGRVDSDPAAPDRAADAAAPGMERSAGLAEPDQESSASAREVAAPPDVESAAAPAAMKFDDVRPLRGRVVPDVPLPRDESIEIVVETWSRPSRGLTQTERMFQGFGNSRDWAEVARVAALADGTFEAPRPTGVSAVRIRAEGDYVHSGEYDFDVDGKEDPGATRLELPVFVGAHVTLELDLGEIATPEEIASLAGDIITFDSMGRTDSRMAFSGQPYGASAALGADGRAVLRGLIPYDWRVSQGFGDSEHQPLAPFRVRAGFHFQPDPGERMTVKVPMERGLRFEGHVRDLDGTPIEGATIAIPQHWQTGAARGSSWSRRDTDKEGHFLIQALPTDPDSLKIKATGFLEYQLGPDEFAALLGTTGPHDLVLTRGRSLTVEVKAQGGRPAKGVAVTLTPTEGRKPRSTRTNAEGVASFVGLPAGDCTLGALGRHRPELQKEAPEPVRFLQVGSGSGMGAMRGIDPDVETLWAATINIPASTIDAGTVLPLDLTPVPMIRGQITGADPSWGPPLMVSVYSLDSSASMFGRFPGTTGTFRLDPATGKFHGQLPPGRYEAVATSGRPPNGRVTADSPKMRTSNTVPFEVKTNDVELQLAFGATLRIDGVARLRSGTPLADVEVQLSRPDTHRYLPREAHRTNQRGEFAFGELDAGDYILHVRSSRFVNESATEVTLVEGRPTGPVEVVVERAGAVRVTVLDTNGEPITDARTRVLGLDGSPTYARVITDVPGWSGAMGPLRPGAYMAMWDQALERGSVRLQRERITVKAGEVTEVRLASTLEGTSILTGLVTAGGAPAPGVRIWLSDELGLAGIGGTDDEGRYKIDCIASGAATLCVGPSILAPLAERSIELGEGSTAAPTVDLPSGTIEGQLLDDARSMGFGQAVVSRVGADPAEPPFRTSGGSSNGRFTILYLPDGQYELYVSERGGKPSEAWESQMIEIKNGERVRGVQLVKRR